MKKVKAEMDCLIKSISIHNLTHKVQDLHQVKSIDLTTQVTDKKQMRPTSQLSTDRDAKGKYLQSIITRRMTELSPEIGFDSIVLLLRRSTTSRSKV